MKAAKDGTDLATGGELQGKIKKAIEAKLKKDSNTIGKNLSMDLKSGELSVKD